MTKYLLLSLGLLFHLTAYSQDGYLYYLGLGQEELLRMDSTGMPEALLKGRLSGSADIHFNSYDEKIYWVVGNAEFQECVPGRLYRANRDGSDIELVYESDLFKYRSIRLAFDGPNNKMYWALAYSLFELDLLSLASRELFSGERFIGDLFLDHSRQKLYYTNTGNGPGQPGSINVFDIPNESAQQLFNLESPAALVVDTVENHIYCTNQLFMIGVEIHQFDMDGNYLSGFHTGLYDSFQELVIDQAAGHLYYTLNHEIGRADLMLNNREIIWQEEESADYWALVLGFDPLQQELFWLLPPWGTIWKSTTSDFEPELVVDNDLSIIEDFLVDKSNERVYWAEGNRISFADYEFTATHTLALDADIAPVRIALDVNNDAIYWVDKQDHRIHRADLSGTVQEEWSSADEENMDWAFWNMQIDSETHEMFWLDVASGTFMKSSLVNFQPDTIFQNSEIVWGFDLDRVNQRLFWIDTDGGESLIKSIDYGGANLEILATDSPLEGSFDYITVSGENMVIRKRILLPDIYISADQGLNFHRRIPTCQPAVFEVVGDFFFPMLVNQDNIIVERDFQVFPNPSSGFVQLNIADDFFQAGPLQATLISAAGQVLRSYQLTSSSSEFDWSLFPAGLYYLQLRSNDGTIFPLKKIVLMPD